MERYLFTADGYRCLDVDGSILYESKGHEDLFHFIDQDDSELYGLLREYIEESVDIEKRKPKRRKRKDHIYFKLSEQIQTLHPFCTEEYLDREIARYFNQRLAASWFHAATYDSAADLDTITEKQYSAMFQALFPYGFALSSHAGHDDMAYLPHFERFCRFVQDEEAISPTDAPFADLRQAKQQIKDYLYWVLDSQAKPFRELAPDQRLHLYNAYHLPDTFRIAKATVEYYGGNESGVRFNGAFVGLPHEAPLTEMLSDGRSMGEAVQGLASDAQYNELCPEAKSALARMVAGVKDGAAMEQTCAVYTVHDLHALLYIECQRMFEAGAAILRCERCGRYFVPGHSLQRYCDRPISEDSGQTCRDVGAKESVKKKLSDDPAYRLYVKAYRTHHARIRAGRMTKPELDAWVREAKRRMNEAQDKPALLNAFAEWLKT